MDKDRAAASNNRRCLYPMGGSYDIGMSLENRRKEVDGQIDFIVPVRRKP